MLQRSIAGVGRLCVALMAMVCLLGFAGCVSSGAIEQVSRKSPLRELTKAELLNIVKKNMDRLQTIEAAADIRIMKYDFLAPASRKDEKRRQRGKPFQKEYPTSEFTGRLLMSRLPDGARRICISHTGQSSLNFLLLGVDNNFRMSLPNMGLDPNDPGALRGRVLEGVIKDDAPRLADEISIRPQDICDLFLQDEVHDVVRGETDVLCYRETWEDSYILTFLRLGWPHLIQSRIWIDRQELRVSRHQLFDRTGEVFVEARFSDYKTVQARTGGDVDQAAISPEIPSDILFFWPRDSLTIQLHLKNIRANESIPSDSWNMAAPAAESISFGGIMKIPHKAPLRDAPRRELIAIVKEDMDRLLTLKAGAGLRVTKYDLLVPASIWDEGRRRRGKSYKKTHPTTEFNGYLFISRLPQDERKIRFSVTGRANLRFLLLGVGNKFWISMPNRASEADDPSAPRGQVLVGVIERDDLRPRDQMSVRPQDVCDLLLQDEVYDVVRDSEAVLCYRETWKNSYILTFIRYDWPDKIQARIWIDRKDFHVTMHQLFDRSGEVFAEARFGKYETVRARKGKALGGAPVSAEVPLDILFIWPRDSLAMRVYLKSVFANENILERNWNVKLPPGYDLVPLTIPRKMPNPAE